MGHSQGYTIYPKPYRRTLAQDLISAQITYSCGCQSQSARQPDPMGPGSVDTGPPAILRLTRGSEVLKGARVVICPCCFRSRGVARTTSDSHTPPNPAVRLWPRCESVPVPCLLSPGVPQLWLPLGDERMNSLASPTRVSGDSCWARGPCSSLLMLCLTFYLMPVLRRGEAARAEGGAGEGARHCPPICEP